MNPLTAQAVNIHLSEPCPAPGSALCIPRSLEPILLQKNKAAGEKIQPSVSCACQQQLCLFLGAARQRSSCLAAACYFSLLCSGLKPERLPRSVTRHEGSQEEAGLSLQSSEP